MYRLTSFFTCLIALPLWSQTIKTTAKTVDTSVNILSLKTFIQQVILEHPLSKQAYLKTEFGKTSWMLANGNFDPILSLNAQSKESQKYLYYRRIISQLTVPTPLGIDIIGGYRNTDGDRLNPEQATTSDGQWFAGLEINALQGLMIDPRRAQLRQAELVESLNTNETKIILNELLFQSIKTYIYWQQYYHITGVYQEGLTLAQTYFKNTKGSFVLGEKNAIDTLEAYIMVQDHLAQIAEVRQKTLEYKLKLQNFMWFENNPQSIKPSVIPEGISKHLYPLDFTLNIDSTLSTHPLISQKLDKKKIEEINLELKEDKLKPKLKLKYIPFMEAQSNLSPQYNERNFNWGISFSMPTWLRSERAQIKRSEIKLQGIDYDIANKKNELKNKAMTAQMAVNTFSEMATILKQNVAGYKTLLRAEQLKFSFGESSVFLVTKRQEKYIKMSAKYIKSRAQEEIARIEFLYHLNQILN